MAGASKRLLRVVAPHFTAGIVFDGDAPIEAAPILAWALRCDKLYLSAYFKKKGWRAHWVRARAVSPKRDENG